MFRCAGAVRVSAQTATILRRAFRERSRCRRPRVSAFGARDWQGVVAPRQLEPSRGSVVLGWASGQPSLPPICCRRSTHALATDTPDSRATPSIDRPRLRCISSVHHPVVRGPLQNVTAWMRCANLCDVRQSTRAMGHRQQIPTSDNASMCHNPTHADTTDLVCWSHDVRRTSVLRLAKYIGHPRYDQRAS